MPPDSLPVLLRPAGDPGATAPPAALVSLAAVSAAEVAGDLHRSADLARALGREAPRPGAGSTVLLWELLATLGAADLTVARVVEPHLDALAILDQAGGVAEDEVDLLWGVYAAEGPPPRLVAGATRQGWELNGRKHWCSVADVADRALMTAWVDEDNRQLFSVPLSDPGVKSAAEQAWVARGLQQVTSTALDLHAVPAEAVGEPGWYLQRPGFAWGGMGVAAVWYGGAVGVARRLLAQAEHRALDQVGQMHLGAVEASLIAARAVLVQAAEAVDAGQADAERGERLALTVRQVVRRAAEEVLLRAEHALGPGPKVSEPAHAARTADLELYLRQEHAERDQAALGRWLLDALPEVGW
jgi:alkylation response protein AidB-like acyl-CoA dehydrogenase